MRPRWSTVRSGPTGGVRRLHGIGPVAPFIEDYITDVVLPLYANTHTESSGTGLQTTRFREDARDIIADCVGATDEHAVLFCGSGSTAAIAKMVGRARAAGAVRCSTTPTTSPTTSRPTSDRWCSSARTSTTRTSLPWRESIADVVTIDEDIDGHVDLAHLQARARAVTAIGRS